jgi:hypothetical protein
VLVALLQALYGPVPLFFGPGIGNQLADGARHDGDLLAAQFLHHRDGVLDVLHRHRSILLVFREQIAFAEHQRDTAPAGQAVIFQQLADMFRVVLLGFTADFNGVIPTLRQTGNRHFDRFSPHPVVHRYLHRLIPLVSQWRGAPPPSPGRTIAHPSPLARRARVQGV